MSFKPIDIRIRNSVPQRIYLPSGELSDTLGTKPGEELINDQQSGIKVISNLADGSFELENLSQPAAKKLTVFAANQLLFLFNQRGVSALSSLPYRIIALLTPSILIAKPESALSLKLLIPKGGDFVGGTRRDCDCGRSFFR